MSVLETASERIDLAEVRLARFADSDADNRSGAAVEVVEALKVLTAWVQAYRAVLLDSPYGVVPGDLAEVEATLARIVALKRRVYTESFGMVESS